MKTNTLNNQLEIEVKPSLKVLYLYLIGISLALIAKWYLFFDMPRFELIWRIAAIAAGTIMIYQYLKRSTTYYTINPIEIVGHEGILSTKTTRIPLNRITNYDNQKSLVGRILGLESLSIDTPGSKEYELVLEDLNSNDARHFTDTLKQYITQQKIADAGDNIELRRAREKALAV